MAIENNDNKKKTTIWLRPSMIARMDGWLLTDNCDSRSEFIEKALRFYMGHLAAEDQTEFLSDALVGVMRGMVEVNTHRICRMLFKECVELNMMSHVIAAHYKADPIDVRALRAFAVDEVKHTNGAVSFDKSLAHQRKLWVDEDYDDCPARTYHYQTTNPKSERNDYEKRTLLLLRRTPSHAECKGSICCAWYLSCQNL